MPEIKFMKGNEALAEAAIRAGMSGYFGYPITPQSEVIEYLALEEPRHKYVLLKPKVKWLPSIWSMAPPVPVHEP